MIRKLLFFNLILFINFNSYSQVKDVVTNLSLPRGLVVNNGKLYISESLTDKVLEFDLNTENTIDFATSVIHPIGLLRRGNNLLIAENNGFKISKKELTASQTTAVDFVTFPRSFVEAWGIALSKDQNTLYISEIQGEIYKADLTQTNPIADLIWTNEQGTTIDLALNGNDLYISEAESRISGLSSRILKIDITSENPTPIDVVTDLNIPIGLEIVGTELFFTDSNDLANGTDMLKKIDLTESNPEVITILDNLNGPTYLTYSNGELYISQENKVSKISLATLGINELNTDVDFKIYPNPTTNFINLININLKGKFEIFDMLGNRVSNGNLIEKIDVRNLSSGTYFLKIEQTINRFVKK